MAGSASYERRNAAARALGYRNYYDYRTHNHGTIPATQPRPTGELRQRLRGHRSASDLANTIKTGRVELIMQFPVGERDPATGQFKAIEFQVIMDDGTTRTYILRGDQLDKDKLAPLRDAIVDAGLAPYATYPKIIPLEDDEEPEDLERDDDDELGNLEDFDAADFDADIPF